MQITKKLLGINDVKEVRHILTTVFPLIIIELFESILSITDTIFVSRLGEKAIAAIGISGYLLWVFNVLLFIFFIGIMVLLSQAYGERNYQACARIIGENIITCILYGLILMIILLLVQNEIVSMVGKELSLETRELAMEYINIRLLGFPLVALSLVFDASMRAVSFNKLLLYAYISSITTNIILDPLLIYGYFFFPRMGVQGAALASVISQVVLTLLLLLLSKKLPFRYGLNRPSKTSIKTLWIGFPGVVERMIFSFGNLVYASIIGRCGDVAMASHTIGLRVESFVYTPLFAFSTVSTSIVGQSIGKKEFQEAYNKGLLVAKLSCVLMALLGFILVMVSPFAPRMFSNNSSIISLAMIYLILAGLSEPGLGLAMTLSSAIRGAGNTVVPMLINTSLLFMIRVSLAYIFVTKTLFEPSVIGAWIAMFIDVYLRGFVFLFIYKKSFHKLAKKLI